MKAGFACCLSYSLMSLGLLAICRGQDPSTSATDPFAFFRPAIDITNSDRARLDDGSGFARVLPAKGFEIGVLAGIPVGVDGDRLVAWERRIEDFKRSPYVIASGRFSDPPRIEDLDKLDLDAEDVGAIRSCRQGHCELKLSFAEMGKLQRAETEAGSAPDEAVQRAFRQVVLNRVQQFLADGRIPPDDDHRQEVQPSLRFDVLLDHMPFLRQRLPEVDQELREYPAHPDGAIESFFYWSKERLAHKAVISVTHVNIVRNRNQRADIPDTLVIGRDVFSTHYIDASLSVTALMHGSTSGTSYLLYVNRTEVDVLHGVFAGMIRHLIESRLKNADAELRVLRRRLESGNPPETRD